MVAHTRRLELAPDAVTDVLAVMGPFLSFLPFFLLLAKLLRNDFYVVDGGDRKIYRQKHPAASFEEVRKTVVEGPEQENAQNCQLVLKLAGDTQIELAGGLPRKILVSAASRIEAILKKRT